MPQSARKRRAKFVRKTKAERQREIVEATVYLIGKYGVEGTTVSRIAQAAGIARGALYQHFLNREAVLEAALDSWREQSSAWLARSPTGDVPQQLLRMGEAHSSWALSEGNTFIRPFFQLLASNRESSVTRSIIGRHRRDFDFLAGLVEEGKRLGSIAPDVEAGDVAWGLLLHAWGEDIARLMGVEQFITGGVSRRLLERLLSSYAPDPAASATDAAAANGAAAARS